MHISQSPTSSRRSAALPQTDSSPPRPRAASRSIWIRRGAWGARAERPWVRSRCPFGPLALDHPHFEDRPIERQRAATAAIEPSRGNLPRPSCRRWVRRPGPAQRPLVNRVRVGRQQLSAGEAVCRSQPGRRTERRARCGRPAPRTTSKGDPCLSWQDISMWIRPGATSSSPIGWRSCRRHGPRPGASRYAFSADPIEPGRVLLFERWESKAALATHLEGLRSAPAPAQRHPNSRRRDPAVRDRRGGCRRQLRSAGTATRTDRPSPRRVTRGDR